MKTLEMMCDVIPAALEREQPIAFLSGPSFAKEVRTSLQAACLLVPLTCCLPRPCVAVDGASPDYRRSCCQGAGYSPQGTRAVSFVGLSRVLV